MVADLKPLTRERFGPPATPEASDQNQDAGSRDRGPCAGDRSRALLGPVAETRIGGDLCASSTGEGYRRTPADRTVSIWTTASGVWHRMQTIDRNEIQVPEDAL
jgi:hypothetical protein